MKLLAAIYGFQITLPINVGTWRIEPVTTSPELANTLARDLDAYNLTATIVGEGFGEEEQFNLEGVLCFIEHLDVKILPMSRLSNEQNKPPERSIGGRRNNGGGAVVLRDTISPESRATFINLAMSKLSDEIFCSSTKFKDILFRCIETFRQRSPFIEIIYFLLFSGLEAHARAGLKDFNTKNASIPICNFLKSSGFNVYQEEPKELARSISTYLHLRNALFHQCELETTININGVDVTLNVNDYLFQLSMIVSLAILKAVSFDDGQTNWDSWFDRQSH